MTATTPPTHLVVPSIDVLVVGGSGVDTIVRVESLPVPLADSHVVPPIQTLVGHTGTGVALGCHHLGLSTRLVDVIGDDVEGRMVTDRLATEGLGFDHVVHPSGTRRAVNIVDGHGRRMSFDPRHPVDLEPDPSLWRGPLDATRHVHACGPVVEPRSTRRGVRARPHHLDRPARLGRRQRPPPTVRVCRRPRLHVGLAPRGRRGRRRRRRARPRARRVVVVMDGAQRQPRHGAWWPRLRRAGTSR